MVINAVPVQLQQFATPYRVMNQTKADMGLYAQDKWAFRRLTLNYGLRFEYETGVKEKDGHMIVGFDPNAKLAITDAAPA